MALPDFNEPTVVLFFSILALAAALSFWRGGAPEKSGAFFMVWMILIQSIAYGSVATRFWEVDPVALLGDSILFVGFGAIALNAKRIWPLFAAGLQLISLSAHFARQVEDDVIALAYATMKVVPTGLVLLLLVIGTLFHQHRLRKLGKDLSWADFELWRELWRAPSKQYIDEHRVAFSRSWIGVPIAVCGMLVICYCISALMIPETPEIALGTVTALSAIGGAAIVGGTWLHQRETARHSTKTKAFRDKWKFGVPMPQSSGG